MIAHKIMLLVMKKWYMLGLVLLVLAIAAAWTAHMRRDVSTSRKVDAPGSHTFGTVSPDATATRATLQADTARIIQALHDAGLVVDEPRGSGIGRTGYITDFRIPAAAPGMRRTFGSISVFTTAREAAAAERADQEQLVQGVATRPHWLYRKGRARLFLTDLVPEATAKRYDQILQSLDLENS